jgi:D-3-phosphoglycerate dehydrogenase
MKILITNPIDPEAIEKLRDQHDVICEFIPSEKTLKNIIRDREVLIFRSGVKISAEVMEMALDLKLLIRAGSGIDNLDIEYTEQRKVKLIRVPEPGAKAVAEMSFAFMLALSRNLLEADQSMRQGRWDKYELAGYLLTGKVLGIIGAGSIGSRVGRMGALLGMNVIAYDIDLSPEFKAGLAESGIRLTDFDEVITTADYLSLHMSLNDSTQNMIGADVFSRLKKGSYLINLARGGIVDEKALYTALKKGDRLRGAAIDVHEHEGEGKISPLVDLPNVILTPHIGAMTIDSQREIGLRVIEAVNSFSDGKTDSI